MRRKIPAGLMVAAAAGLVFALLSAPAASAGPYTSRAQYQTTFSLNCNSPSVCGSQNLGGFWGWAQFNFDLFADAQLAGCGHFQGAGLPSGHTTSAPTSRPLPLGG